MPWIYHQRTGVMEHEGHAVGIGYSGHGPGKNVPGWESVHHQGPLPRGNYIAGMPFQHARTGSYTLRLTPGAGTNMFGRAGMLIHGDNPAHPGESSDGCIVISAAIRRQIWTSGDHQIEVVE